MYITSWCGDCKRSKAWFASQHIDYKEINIEESKEATQLVQKINGGMQSVPTIVFPDGSVLVEPTNLQLEEKIKELQM